jgi:hypothetical protein
LLRTTNDLIDCTISATDGCIGRVKDCYFDDETWVVRYLVVDTGTWLSSRKVLIPPSTIVTPDWPKQVLAVGITRQQVEDSPDIDTDRPVSRQHERTLLKHYDYPCYWNGSEPLNDGAAIHDDQHLRSSEAIAKYRILATDGQLGHVAGLLFDERWSIRYIDCQHQRVVAGASSVDRTRVDRDRLGEQKPRRSIYQLPCEGNRLVYIVIRGNPIAHLDRHASIIDRRQHRSPQVHLTQGYVGNRRLIDDGRHFTWRTAMATREKQAICADESPDRHGAVAGHARTFAQNFR